MEAVLNATVAGGVVIGACSDLILAPWASILIGFGGGFISLLGFEVIGPFLASKSGLHDTAGIHNLHGMTGFTGGIISAICAGTATTSAFGDSINIIFPKMKERSPSIQAGYQLAALGLTLGISILSGIFTGLILRSECLQGSTLLFSDRPFWELDGISLSDGEIEDRKELINTNNNQIKDNENQNDKKEIPTERIDLKEMIEMI
jgi:ammonium transporter Rh